MSLLIKTLNEAESLVALWRRGDIPSLLLEEKLTNLGFYDITLPAPGDYGLRASFMSIAYFRGEQRS